MRGHLTIFGAKKVWQEKNYHLFEKKLYKKILKFCTLKNFFLIFTLKKYNPNFEIKKKLILKKNVFALKKKMNFGKFKKWKFNSNFEKLKFVLRGKICCLFYCAKKRQTKSVLRYENLKFTL